MRRAEQDERGARARTPGKLPVLPVLREDRLGWEPASHGMRARASIAQVSDCPREYPQTCSVAEPPSGAVSWDEEEECW